jgi:phage terminase large subunit-like protein
MCSYELCDWSSDVCSSDLSLQGSPETAARAVATLYHKIGADAVIAEANQGGEMVTLTLRTVDSHLPVKLVHATRGKAVRAEPISAVYEQGRGHHVGTFQRLEDELCQWEPGAASPNRLDALVWAGTELVLEQRGVLIGKPRGGDSGKNRTTN